MILNKRKTQHPSLFNQPKESSKSQHHQDNKKKQLQKPKIQSSSSINLKKNSNLSKNLNQIQNTNQNQDFSNLVFRPKTQKKDQLLSNQLPAQQTKDKSKNKNMHKSASMGKLNSKTFRRKSISPINNKQDINLKNNCNHKKIIRTDRDKSKKEKKVVLKDNKKEQKNKNLSQKTTRHQSQHLKTQGSSKMPSITKQIEEKKGRKKFTKSIKTKNIVCFPEKRQKKKKQTIKQKIHNSILYSHGNKEDSYLYSQIAARQNFFMQNRDQLTLEVKAQETAAIIIQKNFRGFLTRKYIQQIKFMISSIVKIQKVWRGFQCRKELKRKKGNNKKYQNPLSIQNSLITIKDFSEEHKDEKNKEKHFLFKVQECSDRKSIKIECTEKKQTKKDDEGSKLAKILQNLLEEEEINEKIKQKIRESLADSELVEKNFESSEEKKKQYIKKRINSQILSEKSFNSPSHAMSPKNLIPLNSPMSQRLISESLLQKTPIDIFHSPRKKTEGQIIKRILSPAEKEETALSLKKEEKKTFQNISRPEIHPFNTSFSFIQEFSLIIVDIIRDTDQQMNSFLENLENFKNFRTNLVLKGWDKFCQDEQVNSSPIFALLDFIETPQLFPQRFRSTILQYPSMKLLLEEGNYYQTSSNPLQQQCEDSFKNCIFDAFNQASYNIFRNSFLPFQKNICFIQSYKHEHLFKYVMLQTILQLRSWCEYFCGAEPPEIPEQNLEEFRFNRIQLMIKDDEKDHSLSHPESWIMWQKIMFGEIIFQTLIVECQNQLQGMHH